jgi:uncharacterized protein YaaQ
MEWIQDFSPSKPHTVIFTTGDDAEAKQLVIELINNIGFVAIDLGSLATGGAMHEVGAPLSGAYVFIIGRRQAELDAAVSLIGENVTAVQGDVSKLVDLDHL